LRKDKFIISVFNFIANLPITPGVNVRPTVSASPPHPLGCHNAFFFTLSLSALLFAPSIFAQYYFSERLLAHNGLLGTLAKRDACADAYEEAFDELLARDHEFTPLLEARGLHAEGVSEKYSKWLVDAMVAAGLMHSVADLDKKLSSSAYAQLDGMYVLSHISCTSHLSPHPLTSLPTLFSPCPPYLDHHLAYKTPPAHPSPASSPWPARPPKSRSGPRRSRMIGAARARSAAPAARARRINPAAARRLRGRARRVRGQDW
ncbi:MAG: hypothetical protein LQ340_004518, partial [Diploschistes diacapsis]